jgi:hypothetical protein
MNSNNLYHSITFKLHCNIEFIKFIYIYIYISIYIIIKIVTVLKLHKISYLLIKILI